MMAVRGLLLLTSSIQLGQVAAAEMPQVLTSMPQEARAARTASKETVAYLNRHIFAGNVLKPLGGGVEQWVVSFCPRWWQPCQQLEQTFVEAARHWQSELNTDPSVLRVRFAQVDCAVDKVLCNEQHVTTYPMVAIYRGGIQIGLKGIAREQSVTALEQFLQTNVQLVPKSQGTEEYGEPSSLPALGKLSASSSFLAPGNAGGLLAEFMRSPAGNSVVVGEPTAAWHSTDMSDVSKKTCSYITLLRILVEMNRQGSLGTLPFPSCPGVLHRLSSKSALSMETELEKERRKRQLCEAVQVEKLALETEVADLRARAGMACVEARISLRRKPFMGNLCCPAAPSPVIVHIYDVTGTAPMQVVNEVLRPFGTGAFHAAVEVHGREWSYGQTVRGPGIFENEPGECQEHSYREAIHMGYTDLSPFEVQMLLSEMAKRWPGREYNLLNKNCCHFSDELCQLLGVGELPSWVTNMAGAASKVGPGLRELRERLFNPFGINRESPDKSGSDENHASR
ncbi:desi2 [Symbiodinium necroappetens]|uniref:Desi2 protein n=1 Tax=Symbiodinium necroappetens TaxID=1628268 RepID=A0A812Z6Q6_9DINO|nr:desi2 [Symbiodinium necroappetens]